MIFCAPCIGLKILGLPNFNMLFQLVLIKFFQNALFSCLPKVDNMIKPCKDPIKLSTEMEIYPLHSIIHLFNN